MKTIAAGVLLGLFVAAGARAQADLIGTPECQRARAALDAAFDAFAQKRRDAAGQLRAARERAAQACFGTTLAKEAASAASRPASDARAGRSATAPAATPPDMQLRPALTLSAPAPRAAPPPVVPPPVQGTVTSCDAGGCWDNLGRRINRVGPNLVGPNGACTVQGVFATCP